MTPRKRPAVKIPDQGSARWVLAAVAVVALLVKAVVLLQLRAHPLLQPRPGLDDAVYLDLARKIAAGDLLGGAGLYFVSPFYMYFLAVALGLGGGSVLAAQLVQIALGAVAVWLVGDTARRLLGDHGGWIAAGLAVVTGYFTFNEILVLQSSVDGFLTAAGLWMLVRACEVPSTGRFLAAGAIVGLHTLNRPNVGLWAVAATGLIWLAGQSRSRWQRAAAYAAGVALALAPVVIRNTVVTGDIAAISAHGGLNFFIGNHQGADGLYQRLPGITSNIEGQSRDMRQVAGAAAGRPVSDLEASSWYYLQAWTWIREQPGAAAALLLRKIRLMFSAAEMPLNDSYVFFSRDETTMLTLLVAGPGLLLPLAIVGLVFGGRKVDPSASASWRMLCGFLVVYALSVAVFFVAGRYRLPLLTAACVAASAGTLWLWEIVRQGRMAARAGALGALAVSALFVLWPTGVDDGRAGWRSEMIVRLIEADRDADAESLVSVTEPSHPNPGLLRQRTARAYLKAGKSVAAIPHLRRALELEPSRAEIQLDLGRALIEAGRQTEAIPYLRAAFAAHVQPGLTALSLAKALGTSGRGEGLAPFLRSLSTESGIDPVSQSALGRVALDFGEPAAAVDLLTRALSARPEDAAAQGSLGVALGLQGRRDEGIKALERANQIDASSAAMHLNLAVAYAAAGRFREAEAEGQAALRLQPNYPRAKEFLAALEKRKR